MASSWSIWAWLFLDCSATFMLCPADVEVILSGPAEKQSQSIIRIAAVYLFHSIPSLSD